MSPERPNFNLIPRRLHAPVGAAKIAALVRRTAATFSAAKPLTMPAPPAYISALGTPPLRGGLACREAPHCPAVNIRPRAQALADVRASAASNFLAGLGGRAEGGALRGPGLFDK